MNPSVHSFMLLLRSMLEKHGATHSRQHAQPPVRPQDQIGATLVLQDPVTMVWLRVTVEPISEAWAVAEMRRKGDK